MNSSQTNRFKSLANRITLRLTIFFTLIMIIVVSILTVVLYNRNLNVSKTRATLLAENVAGEVKVIMERPMDAARAFSATISAVANKDSKALSIDREGVYAMGHRLLLDDNNFLGVILSFEENVIGNDNDYANTPYHDASGRFVNFISRIDGIVTREVITGPLASRKSLWYYIPQSTKTEYATDPFVYKTRGKNVPMIGFETPILHDKRFLGVIGVDYSIDFMDDIVSKDRNIFENKYNMLILSNGGVVVADKNDQDNAMKNLKDIKPQTYQADIKEIQEGKSVAKFVGDNLYIHVPFLVGKAKEFWQVRLIVPKDVLLKESRSVVAMFIGLFALLIVFFLAVFSWYLRSQLKPLSPLANMAQEIAKGELNHDEKINYPYNDEIGVLQNSFSTMKQKLIETVAQIQHGSESVAQASRSLTATSTQLSSGANEGAASLEEINSTVEELVHAVSQSAVVAKESKHKVLDSQRQIGEIGQAARKSLDAILEIKEKIREVTSIASQTNVLALNTGIEAARAGVHGKGFAVVAGEVRQLAEHSRQVADTIGQLNDKSLEITENAGKQMMVLIQEIGANAELIEKVDASAQEQDQSVSQMKTSIGQVNEITQANAALSEELSASAEELSAQAQQLMETIRFFQV